MINIQHILYEDVEDYNAYEFFMMKERCSCQKEFKTIGIAKGEYSDELKKKFKVLIPTKNIHPKQAIILYSKEG
jgi:hypothetical protein